MIKMCSLIFFLSASFQSLAYTVDEFINTLNESNVTDIDEAISLLPISIRSHFSLVHTGKGLRETSYLEPAVIGFDPDGSFFVNVGSKDLHLGNKIEILQFNRATEKIELFSLDFPLRRDAQGLIQRPEVNPPKCLSCHGPNPNALWGDYGKWEGSYGSDTANHDTLTADEKVYLAQFKANTIMKAPYRYFQFDISSSAPFTSGKIRYNFDLKNRPNSHLSLLFSRINSIKIGRQLLASPLFEESKFDILYELLCSSSLEKNFGLLTSLGLSETDINQMKWDGVLHSKELAGIHLVNSMKQNSSTKKIKNLLGTMSIIDRYSSSSYFEANRISSLPKDKIKPYQQLDDLIQLPLKNQKLCKYLKNKTRLW